MLNSFVFQRRFKLVVLGVAFACAIVGWTLSKRMSKAWLAETTVTIVQGSETGSLAGVAGQLGGVAALLGANMAGGADVNETLATLRSRLLVVEFLKHEGRLEKVLALTDADGSKSAVNVQDALNQAVDYFQRTVLSVSYDARSGLVGVSVTWRDRHSAAEWANAYIDAANDVLRRRAIDEARRRIGFLREAAEKAETIGLRQSIYGLMESQVRAEMLATTRPEFAFRVVDPAVAAQANAPVRPKSWLIAVIAAVLGAVAAAVGLAFLWRRSGTTEAG